MSKRKLIFYLYDILESIEKIETYTSGLSFEDFQNNGPVYEAVIYNFAVIGEAINHIYPTIKELERPSSSIEWRSIVDMRNELIHEYFGVIPSIVWEAVEQDLEPLKEEIRYMKSQYE